MKLALHAVVAVLGGLSVVLVGVLVVSRLTGSVRRRHHEKQRHALRILLLTALLGDAPKSSAAFADLGSRTGRSWGRAEEAAFALLPKIKGDSRLALVRLLTERGAADRAKARAGSRSLVRRARGAYQLGALARTDALPVLLPLLRDRQFVVRRGAVRALGTVGSPEAVQPLLDAVATDDALAGDVVAALTRIGPAAAPPLREALGKALTPGHRPPAPEHRGPPVRRAAVTAHALGRVGDVSDTRLLVPALRDQGRHPGLAEAAAGALGLLGSPEAVQPLLAALGTPAQSLRLSAAKALGDISDKAAAPGLVAALPGAGHEDARAIAAALLQLGPEGLRALERSASPYAAEALAVHALRQSA